MVALFVISKISRQKNNQQRYNIYINDEYSFSVDESTLIKFGLTKGKVLDQFEIDEINYEDEIAKAFNAGLYYLSFQMRSEHEVKKKLLDKGYGESVVLEAIQKLSKLGFLNDETYSKALLESKKRFQKKGPYAIKEDLRKKGIDKSLQDKVLGTFSYDEQKQLATQLAEKTVKLNSKKTPTQIKQKIQETLLRKGYSFSIVEDVLSDIQIQKEEDEWQDLIGLQGEKVWNKYSKKYEGFELHIKVKQVLYQKGFPTDLIEQFINEKENEEQ